MFDEITNLITGIWTTFISLLSGFIDIPLKIFEYFIDFSKWFLAFLSVLFYILNFVMSNIWFLGLVFVGVCCVKAWINGNNGHEKLMLFFQNVFSLGIFAVKWMFSIMRFLYYLSLHIIQKIIELIPIIE